MVHKRFKPAFYDALLLCFVKGCGFLCGLLLLLLLFFFLKESLPAFESIGFLRFLTDDSWHPLAEEFNMAPMIIASVVLTTGSVCLTLPLGIGSGIFLHFYAPAPLGSLYRQLIEVLAGIPSVVYGLWGLIVIVPVISEVSPLAQGQSLLAGIIVLSMMSLPLVALSCDAALGAVPESYLTSASALGFTRHALAWKIALPVAWRGIFTGTVLQAMRAFGETMAIVMVCGNIVQLPSSPFDPIRALTANIALEMGYATEEHRSVLFVSGLLLFLIITLFTLGAEWLYCHPQEEKKSRRYG